MKVCNICRQQEAKVTLVFDDDDRKYLCNDCYNNVLSEQLGVALESSVESMKVKDGKGIFRTFQIEQRLDPIGIIITAMEQEDHGYVFAVHGELDCDQKALMEKLESKIKQGVAASYMKTETYPNGQTYHSLNHHQLLGRVKHSDDHHFPVIVIDGKPYTWEELGKLLKTYEGFQLEWKMHEITDDVD